MLQKLAFTTLAITGLFALTAGTGLAQNAPGKKTTGGYAVINSDGSVEVQHNVTSVSHSNTGVYYVQMARKVDNCAATATIAGDSQTLAPGYVVIAKQGDMINVNTYATVTLLPEDYKFDLIVDCAK
jgi:hypothetical protein